MMKSGLNVGQDARLNLRPDVRLSVRPNVRQTEGGQAETPAPVTGSPSGWDDNDQPHGAPGFRPLTRAEVAALVAREPAVSPWRVVAVQAVVGGVAALVGWLITGQSEVMWSLLYGAATVVVPGALMARGMTSRLSSMSPGASAVSFMLWEMVKIGVSLVMLVVAGQIVQPLSWPALLVGLVVCIKVYWVALLWRRRVN